MLPLRLELTVKRAYFIICESPLPTVLCIHCSVSLIIMNRVIIPTIHHSQSWLHCLHLMDATPLSCAINIISDLLLTKCIYLHIYDNLSVFNRFELLPPCMFDCTHLPWFDCCTPESYYIVLEVARYWNSTFSRYIIERFRTFKPDWAPKIDYDFTWKQF